MPHGYWLSDDDYINFLNIEMLISNDKIFIKNKLVSIEAIKAIKVGYSPNWITLTM